MRAPPSGQLNAAITLRSPEAVASGKLVAPRSRRTSSALTRGRSSVYYNNGN